jgi:hypothetical protein
MPLSIYAKWNRDREKVIVLQRDMIRQRDRIIEKQCIEIARLKSELARLEKKSCSKRSP